jgi:hypothetical protein
LAWFRHFDAGWRRESRYHQFGAVDLDYLRKNAPEMLKFLAKRKAR